MHTECFLIKNNNNNAADDDDDNYNNNDDGGGGGGGGGAVYSGPMLARCHVTLFGFSLPFAYKYIIFVYFQIAPACRNLLNVNWGRIGAPF